MNCFESLNKLKGSKGILFIIKKEIIIKMLNRSDINVRKMLISIFFNLSETTSRTPLIPNPSNAMLIIIKAK